MEAWRARHIRLNNFLANPNELSRRPNTTKAFKKSVALLRKSSASNAWCTRLCNFAERAPAVLSCAEKDSLEVILSHFVKIMHDLSVERPKNIDANVNRIEVSVLFLQLLLQA